MTSASEPPCKQDYLFRVYQTVKEAHTAFPLSLLWLYVQEFGLGTGEWSCTFEQITDIKIVECYQ
jgi:hypothetical protein